MKVSNELNFFQKLKDKKSTVIQEELTKFVNEDFKQIVNLDKKEVAKKVQETVSKFVIDFSRLWKVNILNNQSNYMEICDGFESILTKSLYNKVFCSTRKEKEKDYNFEKLVKKFQFVTPKHLDIDESIIDAVYIEVAINKLSMINQFKPPKDKGVILINFCNILTSMITENSNKSSKIAGADEVFPLVVYAILKGNVRKLKSNLKYIQLFRHETRLESQEEYYFTTINSALEFIENSNHNKLDIKEAEFNAHIEESQRNELERMKNPLTPARRNNDENQLLYHLNNGIKQEESSNCIELSDFNQNILINTDSVISKTLMNTDNYNNTGLMHVDLDKLYREYFNSLEFNEMSIFKIEKMSNDFKIMLKLINSFKQGCYSGSGSNTENNEQLLDI